MEPNRPATTSDEDAKAKPKVPATRPGAVSVSDDQSTSTSATPGDEKAAYRSAPASRPGAFKSGGDDIKNNENASQSIAGGGSTAPTVTSHTSEPRSAATTTSSKREEEDEKAKAKYRTAPSSRPPGTAAMVSPSSMSPRGGSSVTSSIRDEKSAYRSSRASQPGVQSVSSGGGGSGGGGASSSTSSLSIADEKAQFRSSRATVGPGAQSVSSGGGGASSSTSSLSIADEKAQFRSSRATAGGTVTSVSNSSISLGGGSGASTSGTGSMQDEKAAYRSASRITPLASPAAAATATIPEHHDDDDDDHPHDEKHEPALSTADASAAVQSVEQDLLAKRQPSQRATRPGVIASSNNDENDAASRKSRAGRAAAVAGVAAAGGTAAGLAVANNNTAATDAAVVAAVEQDLLAKRQAGAATAATAPGAVNSGAGGDPENAALIVGAVEQDLVQKRQAASAQPATQPGVVDAAVVAAVESDIMSKELSMKSSNMGSSSQLGIQQSSQQSSLKDPSSNMLMVEPKSSLDMMPEQEKSKEFNENDENEDGLAIARPVKEEPVVLATDFDPSGGKPFYQKTKFLIIAGVAFCLCISAIVVGVSVAVTRDDDDEEVTFTDFPTVAPSVAPTSSAEVALRDWLETDERVTQRHIDYSPVSYEMALRWYANEDPGFDRSGPLEEWQWTLQRFVMAWVYFHGTSNGTKPWVSCNPPVAGSGQDENCVFLELKSIEDVNADDPQVLYEEVPSKRWLSAAHECEWAGNRCRQESERSNFLNEAYHVCIYAMDQTRLRGNGYTGTWPLMLNLMSCTDSIVNGFNPGLTGSIPDDFWSFEVLPGDGGVIREISIVRNSAMTGTMPDTVFQMGEVVAYELQDTPLAGHGDHWWMWTLQRLILGNMDFLDEIPNNFNENATNFTLSDLRIFNNKNLASLEIPDEIGDLQALERLWLQGNGLEGTLPDSIGDLVNMIDFRVSQNSLNGTIPQDLQWEKCRRFEVFSNSLSGELPKAMNTWEQMNVFLISENRFSGEIDPALGTAFCKSIKQFVIRGNQFSGDIPDTFRNCRDMTSFLVNLNNFTGEFPFGICQLRSRTGLQFIHADCLDYPPQVFCQCCTTCCNPISENCQTGNLEIENRMLRGSPGFSEGVEEDEDPSGTQFLSEDILSKEREPSGQQEELLTKFGVASFRSSEGQISPLLWAQHDSSFVDVKAATVPEQFQGDV